MAENVLKLTDDERKRLEAAGVNLFYGEIHERAYSLREVARIADMAEAWVRQQLKSGGIAGKHAKDGNRTVWRVSWQEVVRLRQEQADKHLGRLDRKATGKKYLYRRPTEWASHLLTKAINNDKILKPNEKKVMREALKRYEVQWEQEYQERLVKRAAKAAEEAKNEVKQAK